MEAGWKVKRLIDGRDNGCDALLAMHELVTDVSTLH